VPDLQLDLPHAREIAGELQPHLEGIAEAFEAAPRQGERLVVRRERRRELAGAPVHVADLAQAEAEIKERLGRGSDGIESPPAQAMALFKRGERRFEPAAAQVEVERPGRG
jgi:hypothetical protein